MASVQERLQLKRAALDTWSIREQLCLASAVTCSGDQNWMTVSRALKQICGNGRHSEWFSQKSCAVQYGELLENAETPKRKKRTGLERENPGNEIPTEAILRKLTQDRINEIKLSVQQQQDEYAKISEEIQSIENGTADESELKAMWQQIEKELEQKELEKQITAQWTKEREEKKVEMQRSPWRQPGTFQQSPTHPSQTKPAVANVKPKQEEMDVDEPGTNKGTSPLLTSLLKSPSNSTTTVTSTLTTATTPTSVRQTAPTITNLLTGTTAPQTLLQTAASTPQPFNPIQNQPLTGPVPTEPTPQVTPTPSQAAPTLSMLLESKNAPKLAETTVAEKPEPTTTVENKQESDEAMETEESQDSPSKEEEQQLMEVLNGLIPDNIDEFEDILTNNNAIILNPELLEEESILENVESLMEEPEDIEVKSTPVDEEQKSSSLDSKNLAEPSDSSKIKEEIKEENDNALDPEPAPKIADSSGGGGDIQESIILDESNDKTTSSVKNQPETIEVADTSDDTRSQQGKEEDEKEVIKQEPEQIEVSDDSSDNTCLQNVKENSNEDHKDKASSDTKSEKSAETPTMDQEESLQHVPSKPLDKVDISDTDSRQEVLFTGSSKDIKKEKIESNITEIIEIHEVSSSSDSKTEPDRDEIKTPNPLSVEDKKVSQEEDNKKKIDLTRLDLKPDDDKIVDSSSGNKDNKSDVEVTAERVTDSTPITIIDTDDDSPMEVKEDRMGKTKRDYSRKKSDTIEKKPDDIVEENRSNLTIRKLKEREGSESPLVDDDNPDSIPRTRRRYSSTPVIDSIPNSPASSDDREYKAWKKSILMVYNRLLMHKYATTFLKPVSDEQAPNYKTIILRPMDLQTIKRNLESGVIRTTIEFQRDVLLMCQNAIMYYKKENNIHQMAKELMTDSVQIIESTLESIKKEAERTQATSSMIKSRVRKSRH